MPIRLVATDLDGTLLQPDLTVSPRTRAALDAVRAAGVHVVPVTARQPIGLREIAVHAGFTEWAVCSNGSLGIHLSTGNIIFEEAIDAEAQRRLAERLSAQVEGILYASVRDRGEAFVAQEGYAAIATFWDHKRSIESMGAHPLADVLAKPSLKLIVRHPERTSDQLLEIVRELSVDGLEATHSGAPFVEVMASGVTKASGLARLCSLMDISPDEVLAFGDAPNDAEMLAWAGRGVAVGNADPITLSAADEVTASNEDDGVAMILERLLD